MIIQSFGNSSATSIAAFYQQKLPKLWSQEGLTEPTPAKTTLYKWLQNTNQLSQSIEEQSCYTFDSSDNQTLQQDPVKDSSLTQANKTVIKFIGLSGVNCTKLSHNSTINHPHR